MEYFGRVGRVLVNADQPSLKADDSTKESLLIHIADVEDFLRGFRVPATLESLLDLREVCGKPDASDNDVGLASQQVFERFAAEAGDQWLLLLGHDHTDLLNDDSVPFGPEIRDKFPTFSEDIDEAGKCLALGRYTAAVFHLMRVMESSVHVIAKKMKVSVDPRVATWNEITTSVSVVLSHMPAKSVANKRRKAIYGEIIANLNSVRIAWRNEVMHPKRTYTKKETERIFSHVEGFLTSLAAIM